MHRHLLAGRGPQHVLVHLARKQTARQLRRRSAWRKLNARRLVLGSNRSGAVLSAIDGDGVQPLLGRQPLHAHKNRLIIRAQFIL